MVSYDDVNGDFICEAEEIIISNKWMSFDDYLALNKIGFTCYLLTIAEYFVRVVDYLIENTDINITHLFHDIMNPPEKDSIEASYRKFLDDYDQERIEELSETYEEAKQKMEESFRKAGNQVLEPSRLNVKFASRLIYQEKWFAGVLWDNLKSKELKKDDKLILQDLINVCDEEWVNLLEIHQQKKLSVTGLTHEYLGTIKDHNRFFPYEKYDINFTVTDEQKHILGTYMNRYVNEKTETLNTNALDFITPRRRLRYEHISVDDSLSATI